MLEDLLDEFGAEPGEPVSVGNHNYLAVGIVFLHESDLELKVAGLFIAGDPAVADGCIGFGIAQVGLDVVSSLSALGFDSWDYSSVGVPAESVRMETQYLGGFS